jgi:hypothetical protein
MALKIKKQIKNSDGTITELEGTEAEVEAFLKKQSKKDESLVQKKKNLILGREMRAAIQEMIDDALNKTAQFSQSKVVEHHWYHNNGWWWRPTWVGGNYVYQATQYDPNRYAVASNNCITCNSSAELGSNIGVNEGFVVNTVGQGVSNLVGTKVTASDYASNWCAVTNTVGAASTYTCDTNANALTPGNISSGIINLNIKS